MALTLPVLTPGRMTRAAWTSLGVLLGYVVVSAFGIVSIAKRPHEATGVLSAGAVLAAVSLGSNARLFLAPPGPAALSPAGALAILVGVSNAIAILVALVVAESIDRTGKRVVVEWGFGHEAQPLSAAERRDVIAYVRALARSRER